MNETFSKMCDHGISLSQDCDECSAIRHDPSPQPKIGDVIKNAVAAKQASAGEVPDFLALLRRINGERAEAWLMGQKSDPLFWAVELGGEVGEILNVVKKLVREELGWRGSRATVQDLADEIADGIICLDSLARHYGIDLSAAVTAKFNATSEKNGFPHRLPAHEPAPVDPLREAVREGLKALRWSSQDYFVDMLTERLRARGVTVAKRD